MKWLVALFLVAALAVGAWLLLRDVPPGHGELASRLDRVELPDDLRRTGEDRSGNRLCFDECPALDRTYVVVGDVEDAAAAFERTLGRQDFDVVVGAPRAFESATFQGMSADRDDELICVELTSGVATLTSEDRLPEGQVGVRITIELDGGECRGLED